MKLRDMAPKEAQVHVMLGRVYKRLGQADKALLCFNVAIDVASVNDRSAIKSCECCSVFVELLHSAYPVPPCDAVIDKLHAEGNDESADESLVF